MLNPNTTYLRFSSHSFNLIKQKCREIVCFVNVINFKPKCEKVTKYITTLLKAKLSKCCSEKRHKVARFHCLPFFIIILQTKIIKADEPSID